MANERYAQKLAALEAMLFTTQKPLGMEELEKALRITRSSVEKLLAAEAGGYRLVVKQAFVSEVSHLTPHADLSRGLLRVLSIIFYHEPIAQSEIVKIIGNRTYDYVKELEARGLVRSEKKSRTKLLRTTPHFEAYFGAKKEEIKMELKEFEDEKGNVEPVKDSEPEKTS